MNDVALTKEFCQEITSGLIDHRLPPPICMIEWPPDRKVEIAGMEAFMQKFKTSADRRRYSEAEIRCFPLTAFVNWL